MLSVAIHKDIAEYQPKVIGKLIGIVLVLLLGGVTAFTVLSSNKGHDSDTKKEQTQTQKKETSTENAKKKKSAEKSAISVMVTADGAAEDSKASVSVSEKGKNGKIVVKDISVAVNDEVKICTLPKGKYLLTVESAPDGYDKPAKSTSFTVKGNGEKVSAFPRDSTVSTANIRTETSRQDPQQRSSALRIRRFSNMSRNAMSACIRTTSCKPTIRGDSRNAMQRPRMRQGI